jgi:uncharacterized paraquat-inducible protein A
MIDSPATDAPSDQPLGDVPKVRQCLRCQDTFRSEWAGERICPRCKTTAAWRKGVPQQSYPVGKRR